MEGEHIERTHGFSKSSWGKQPSLLETDRPDDWQSRLLCRLRPQLASKVHQHCAAPVGPLAPRRLSPGHREEQRPAALLPLHATCRLPIQEHSGWRPRCVEQEAAGATQQDAQLWTGRQGTAVGCALLGCASSVDLRFCRQGVSRRTTGMHIHLGCVGGRASHDLDIVAANLRVCPCSGQAVPVASSRSPSTDPHLQTLQPAQHRQHSSCSPDRWAPPPHLQWHHSSCCCRRA